MQVDSDVALLGTGVAPLIAAMQLRAQGLSVLLLNPDQDFFLEDSELPLDPLWPQNKLTAESLSRNSSESVFQLLNPIFPGTLEFWHAETDKNGYHDPLAPHVRQRDRLWLVPPEDSKEWSVLEELYVEVSDRNLHPEILEGVQATSRFPGFTSGVINKIEDYRGLKIPKSCDVDVLRYRNGILEFVRERLGQERVLCGAGQIELTFEGIRFQAQGKPRTARLKEGALIFWTPRLSTWIFGQAKKLEITPVLPNGVRLWEEWSVVSRDFLDPSVIAFYKDMTAWAQIEGVPQSRFQADNLHLPGPSGPGYQHDLHNKLAVLRGNSTLISVNSKQGLDPLYWASSSSFQDLHDLCHVLLNWSYFSINSMKPKAIFEWGENASWLLSSASPRAFVVGGCDGPIADVVRISKQACSLLGQEGQP